MAVRLDITTDTDIDPGWLVDRLSLARLRLRAARYGLRIRSRWSLLDFATLIGLPLTLLGLALTILGMGQWRPLRPLVILARQHSLLSMAVTVSFVLASSWFVIRYLGRLSSIMRAAASTESGAKMLREDMNAGMRNPQLYAHLMKIYEPMVEKTNNALHELGYPHTFSFIAASSPNVERQQHYATIALPATSSTRLDNLFGPVSEKRPPEFERFASTFSESRQRLIRKWRELDGKPDFDDEEGPNYTLEAIGVEADSPQPRLVFQVGTASYGQIMRTCHALVNELALLSYFLGHPGCLPLRSSTVLTCLPWRARIHSLAQSDLNFFLRPLNRTAGIGIAVATLFTAPGGERCVSLGMRSDLVGTYPRALHVIPAGMCNTHGVGYVDLLLSTASRYVDSKYLSLVMRSEFLEEWFNDEELESGRSVDWEKQIERKWSSRVREIQPLQLTGIAFDFLNLRPEVCGVVTVEPFDGSLNSEYMLRLPDVKVALETRIRLTEIVQSGAAALMLAKQHLDRYSE